MEKHQTLMHRVLSGLATPQEVDQLQEWLSANPANARTFEDLSLLYQPTLLQDNEDSDSSWIRLKGSINLLERRVQTWHRIKVVLFSLLLFGLMYHLEVFPGLQLNSETHFRNQLVTSVTFQQTPLSDMLNEFQSQYNMQIEFSAIQTQQCKFTGYFRRGTHVRDVLMTIAKASGTKVTFRGTSMAQFTGTCDGKAL